MCLLPDEDAARYLLGDLEVLLPGFARTLHLPPSGQKPYDHEQVADARTLIARAETLQALHEGDWRVFVASADAVAERVAAQTALDESATVVQRDRLDLGAFLGRLDAQGFRRVEFVEEPGDLAVRGGLIDVFPYAGDYPVRIELFGDEVDALREFDPATQRSVARLEKTRLLPNLDVHARQGPSESVFDYLPSDALVAVFDTARVAARLDECLTAARAAYAQRPTAAPEEAGPEALYVTPAEAEAALTARTQIRFESLGGGADIELGAVPQPSVNGKMEVLRRLLREHHAQGLATTILCDTPGQRARLGELLDTEVEAGMVSLQGATLHEGFALPDAGFALYTDHGIFNRYHRPATHRSRRKTGGLSLRDLQNLQPGDFVVHVDHGIGKFAGMETVVVREKHQEAVRLLFHGGDVLYVNVNALYKLSRFTGQEGHQPQLTKLGSGAWERAKAKTKKRVKDIARDLIALYAARHASKGHAFPADTTWQRELEASFEFEDTPDQASAAEAVKSDMEQGVPMDRLVCGDVGFGKTEVAVRAAFKAVQDGKQVAILVPTTILAAQHHETFTRRLEGYPVRIEQLSRFRSPQQQKETLARLEKGEVDIVIGTQRLAGKTIKFKNLGLLVIDEEQRFGVSVKERLRQMRASVDTLTLTATPIPRTLQFSLLGARDLSIIQTPPPNRQPIVTEIHTFDRNLIRDAILHETGRGGQVFFVHNRVQTIEEMAAQVQEIVPGIRVRVAHGQMKADDLEDVMMDFIQKRFDVLVSTNIVESGLDVSNANTMIVNRADRFGLAELHQLRGRVGRSDRRAYCYLLVPSIAGLTREARQRLQALEEFSELGSGFNLAMRDLDIRGAGNLLGAEQSGFVAELGYETYHRILEEAVQELRHDEFQHLFHDAPPPRAAETALDVEEDALIPPEYVGNNVERLNLYRRIAEADGADALNVLREELRDRFGPVPAPVEHLLLGAEMRLLAQRLRLARVQFKNERLWLDTPEPEADAYFYDTLFQPFLARLEGIGRRYVLKETGRKLRVIVQDVRTLDLARDVLARLLPDAESVPVPA
jgi:transcription-repair coupling factor (superfamily II helicase)